jgi:cell fate regulator YaaT (PSP1 superfamily)
MTQQGQRSVVGVRLARSGPVLFFEAAGLDLALHDRVVVPVEGGSSTGVVVVAPRQVIHNDLRPDLPAAVRKASSAE